MVHADNTNFQSDDLAHEASNSAAEQDSSDSSLSQDGSMLLPDVNVTTERLEGRQRQISATIQIPYSVEHVWQILTDYESLADFIPNLTASRQVEHPQGGIRIEQIGAQCWLNLKFCARVVLDMVEQFPGRIDFQMVEGDFNAFSGSWQLQPITISGQPSTNLSYTLVVLPKRTMPIGIIERHLRHNLVNNLAAIRQRADLLPAVE